MDYNILCLLHEEDAEYTFERPDYNATLIYEGCKWFWKVGHDSTRYGPFPTFISCARDFIKSPYA